MENQDVTAVHLFANPLFLLFFWLLIFGISGGVASLVARNPAGSSFFILTIFLPRAARGWLCGRRAVATPEP
jgi:hypothetical protein